MKCFSDKKPTEISKHPATWQGLIDYIQIAYYSGENFNLAKTVKLVGEILYLFLFGTESTFHICRGNLSYTLKLDKKDKREIFDGFMKYFFPSKEANSLKNIVRPLMHFMAAFFLSDKKFKTSDTNEINLMMHLNDYKDSSDWKSLRMHLQDKYISPDSLKRATKLLEKMLARVLFTQEIDIFEKLREYASKMNLNYKMFFVTGKGKCDLYQAFVYNLSINEEDFLGDENTYKKVVVKDLVRTMGRYYKSCKRFEEGSALCIFMNALVNLKTKNLDWKKLPHEIIDHKNPRPERRNKSKLNCEMNQSQDENESLELNQESSGKKFDGSKKLEPNNKSEKSDETSSGGDLIRTFGHLFCEFIFTPNSTHLKLALKPIKQHAKHEKVFSIFRMSSMDDFTARTKFLKHICKDFPDCFEAMLDYLQTNPNLQGSAFPYYLERKTIWKEEEKENECPL